MGEFSAEWLASREAADHRSRAASLADRLITDISSRAATADRPVRVLDLGTGSGSNVRYLASRLPTRQQWCLVDRDRDLLRELTKQVSAWGLDRGGIVSGRGDAFAVTGPAFAWRFEICATDLARLADADAAAAVLTPLFAGRDLVTASALLDLVSESWLASLVQHCAASRASGLFALTYDGRISGTPADEDDDYIRDLVNRHQQTVKGFGRALGPDAVAAAMRLFTAAGYTVACEASDWVLAPADAALQRPLIDGWADAAAAMARKKGEDRVRAWQARRISHLDAGTSTLVVGHQDLAAWPAFV